MKKVIVFSIMLFLAIQLIVAQSHDELLEKATNKDYEAQYSLGWYYYKQNRAIEAIGWLNASGKPVDKDVKRQLYNSVPNNRIADLEIIHAMLNEYFKNPQDVVIAHYKDLPKYWTDEWQENYGVYGFYRTDYEVKEIPINE